MSITEIAVKRPLLIVVIFTVLFIFGAKSYFGLNYNLLPKLEIPTVSITTVYPGAGAAEGGGERSTGAQEGKPRTEQ